MIKTILLLLSFIAALHSDTFQERMQAKLSEGTPSFKADVIDCFDGNAKACLNAGNYYSAEGYKEHCDPKRVGADVATFYKRACDLGNAEGCTAYAMIYSADTQKDAEKDARYYFQKGCDGGDLSACTMLKMMPEEK